MSSGTMVQSSFTVSPSRAIKAVFESPNWMVNVMWLSLGVLLSVIGNIFIFGYGSQVLMARAGRPEGKQPDIDSGNLGNLFMRGLWPFLVQLVASFALSIIVVFPIMLLMFLAMAIAANIAGEAGPPLVMLVGIPLIICASIAMNLVLIPITIRAMICQDFQTAFDFAWIKGFVRIMWKDMLASILVMMVFFLGMYAVGLLLCVIGIFPAMAIVTSSALNLLSQWYEVFLERGGQPVPVSQDLVVDATVV